MIPSNGNGTVTVVGATALVSLVGKASGSLNATSYTKNPLQLGKFWAFTLSDWSNYVARKGCQ
jgi:hypothetical protein